MGVVIFNKDDLSNCCLKCKKRSEDYIVNNKQENDENSVNIASNNITNNLTQQENENNETLNKRNKYRNKFFNNNTLSTIKNKDNNQFLSTYSIKLNDLYTLTFSESRTDKIIKIQSFFRRFLVKKKLDFMKLSIKKISSVEENCLVFNILMIWNNISNISSVSLSENKIRKNLLNKNEKLSFDLKSKNNLKYRYIGNIKNNNKNTNINNDNKDDTLYIKNGFGIIYFEDETKLETVFTNDKISGYAKYKNKTKKEYFKGTYENNELNGFGIYSDKINLVQKIGNFKISGLNGIGIEISNDNDYIYFGEFFQNQKHGIGTLKWKDGLICQGNFCNNKLNGYCLIKYPNNQMYQGQLKKGKMDGKGQFFFQNGSKYIGDYKNDKRDGFGIFIWSDVNESDLSEIKLNSSLSGINQFSAYIGFWSEGKMDGIGMKINNKDVKFGIWKNGCKKEWIEDQINIKNYFRVDQRKYMKLFMSPKGFITQLVGDCFSYGRMSIDVENDLSGWIL